MSIRARDPHSSSRDDRDPNSSIRQAKTVKSKGTGLPEDCGWVRVIARRAVTVESRSS